MNNLRLVSSTLRNRIDELDPLYTIVKIETLDPLTSAHEFLEEEESLDEEYEPDTAMEEYEPDTAIEEFEPDTAIELNHFLFETKTTDDGKMFYFLLKMLPKVLNII